MRTRKEIESEEITHTHTTDGRDGEVTYGNPRTSASSGSAMIRVRLVQSGTSEEGDTQCVIAASTLKEALDLADRTFAGWKEAQVDRVFYMGEDARPEGDPVVLIPKWVGPPLNLGMESCWFRHPKTGEWVVP